MISQLKSRIEEVEKGCGLQETIGSPKCERSYLCEECWIKFKTYKKCLALAEKDKEDKIKAIDRLNKYKLSKTQHILTDINGIETQVRAYKGMILLSYTELTSLFGDEK